MRVARCAAVLLLLSGCAGLQTRPTCKVERRAVIALLNNSFSESATFEVCRAWGGGELGSCNLEPDRYTVPPRGSQMVYVEPGSAVAVQAGGVFHLFRPRVCDALWVITGREVS